MVPSVSTLSTCLPEYSNKVERETACSQWVLQGMADGILGGRWLLDRWVGANLSSFFGQLGYGKLHYKSSSSGRVHLIVPENVKVLVSAV